ncbi:hypothetical protein CFOL_v3_03055, partial [Cephalotus follicularis]
IMATTITHLSVAIPMVIFLANLHILCSSSEPTIAASPAVLPYVTAPNMSLFFPSSPLWPPSSAAPLNSKAFAPVPSSGEFIGKSSRRVKWGGGMAMYGVALGTLSLLGLLFSL